MKSTVSLPTTPTCRVIYIKDDVTYFVGLKTPNCPSTLQQELLNRKIGMSQVIRVEPVQPLQPIQRGHPAAHRMAQYMRVSD
jgi:hypothetical protein